MSAYRFRNPLLANYYYFNRIPLVRFFGMRLAAGLRDESPTAAELRGVVLGLFAKRVPKYFTRGDSVVVWIATFGLFFTEGDATGLIGLAGAPLTFVVWRGLMRGARDEGESAGDLGERAGDFGGSLGAGDGVCEGVWGAPGDPAAGLREAGDVVLGVFRSELICGRGDVPLPLTRGVDSSSVRGVLCGGVDPRTACMESGERSREGVRCNFPRRRFSSSSNRLRLPAVAKAAMALVPRGEPWPSGPLAAASPRP